MGEAGVDIRTCTRSIVAAAVFAVCSLAGVPGARAESAPRRLSLAEAIEIALAHNPQLAIERENIAAAEARTASDATLRLPLLGVKANVLFWDRKITADLGPDIGEITIRDRVTGTIDFSVSQPVSGALVIGTLVDRDRATTAASRARRDAVRIDTAYQVAEAYLAALQARTLGQVAGATLQQLDGDLQHARALLQAGTLQQVDVLRLEAERARVEQQALQAETQALGARRRLARLLDLPDGTALALVDIDTAPPELPCSEDEAVGRARRDRAELRGAAASRSAAELGVSVARASYYPTVSLVGIYSHAATAQFGTAADTAYLGVSLDWNLWDWGKRGADVDAARAASRQAQLAEHALREQIAVDTRATWQAARTAHATLEVAARGLAAAAEAQRLQATRFANGAATTVELLDAETALASAQAQSVIGRYQYLVAWMALSRELGALPQPQPAPKLEAH